MSRETKIVATLGPASNTPEILTRMIAAGVDVVRMNFSHGSANDYMERAQMVRAVAANLGREIAIMADLQGPKIRIGRFAGAGRRQVLWLDVELFHFPDRIHHRRVRQ